MHKVISVEELTPGMMITQVVEQNGPVKIRKVGLVRSQDMITGLSEMGVLKVEIDPEQAIEIEPQPSSGSTTQKLLQGEYDHASQVDSTLSEQFNRSLFLPSVSELPSMTQIYLKQASIFVGVAIVGLGIGFSVAVVPNWLTSKPESSIIQTTPDVSQSAADAAEQAQQPVNETAQITDTPIVSAQPPSDSDSVESASMTANDTLEPASESAPITLGEVTTPEPAQQPAVAEPEVSDALTEALQEGELVTQAEPDTDQGQVSPELLARFNQALEEIETQPQADEPEATVSVRDDIPRVDQLPARTLTLLPSLEFSAHMYASLRSNRWVRVNGMQVYEGEWITDDVQLVNIEPQRVVLSFRGDLFTMAALTDW